MNPLKIFKTEEVRQLLSDFYFLNFEKAFQGGNIGKEIVEVVWNNRNSAREKEIYSTVADLFALAKSSSEYKTTETRPIELFDFKNIKTFLDFGANKLRALNEFGYDNPNVEKLIGVDVTTQSGDFAYPDKSSYIQVDEDGSVLPIEPNSIDLVNIQFVLHHVKDIQTIKNILSNLNKVIKSGGKLLLWEECFEKDFDLEENHNNNLRNGIETNLELTQRFYSLTQEQRNEFIIANDWIINVANPHMQWTGMYHSWEQWVKILNDTGFVLNEHHNLGLRVNGQLKQGVHIVGMFTKI